MSKSGQKIKDREWKKQQVDKEKALEFKNKGNLKFQQGEYQSAIYLFSRGIELDPNNPTNYIFFSNRSAAYFALPDYKKALEDAETVLKLKPDWPKGYSRKGAALVGCKKLEDAIDTYQEGLKYDPSNQLLLEGLEVAQSALAASRRDPPEDGSKHRSEKHKDKTLSPSKRSDSQNAGAHTPTKQSRSKSSKSGSTKPGTGTGPFATLTQLPSRPQGAHWHLEIVRDRIWLFDGGVHYRPQTAYLFDENRLEGKPSYLAIQQHHNNSTWQISEMVDLFGRTCKKYNLQPDNVNMNGFTPTTYDDIRASFAAAGLATSNNPPPGHLANFIATHIATEESAQEEEWGRDPSQKFASVIWKRKHRGMLKMPGTNPHMIGGLLQRAAEFWQAEAAKDFDKHLTIQNKDTGEVTVASIVNTGTNNYGIAKFQTTEEVLSQDPDKQQVSFLFSEKMAIPFEDVDDIERFGWTIANEQAYPLPLVYNPDHTTVRPSADDLKWFELAFGAITQYVVSVWRNPTLDKTSAYQLKIEIHSGSVDVIVQPPTPETPREDTTTVAAPAVTTGGAPSSPNGGGTTSSPRMPPNNQPSLEVCEEFQAAERFQGRRVGFVFRWGDYGQGYYKDEWTPQQKAAATQATQLDSSMTPAQRAAFLAQNSANKAKQASSGQTQAPNADISSMLMHTLNLLEEERAKSKQKDQKWEETLKTVECKFNVLRQQHESLLAQVPPAGPQPPTPQHHQQQQQQQHPPNPQMTPQPQVMLPSPQFAGQQPAIIQGPPGGPVLAQGQPQQPNMYHPQPQGVPGTPQQQPGPGQTTVLVQAVPNTPPQPQNPNFVQPQRTPGTPVQMPYPQNPNQPPHMLGQAGMGQHQQQPHPQQQPQQFQGPPQGQFQGGPPPHQGLAPPPTPPNMGQGLGPSRGEMVLSRPPQGRSEFDDPAWQQPYQHGGHHGSPTHGGSGSPHGINRPTAYNAHKPNPQYSSNGNRGGPNPNYRPAASWGRSNEERGMYNTPNHGRPNNFGSIPHSHSTSSLSGMVGSSGRGAANSPPYNRSHTPGGAGPSNPTGSYRTRNRYSGHRQSWEPEPRIRGFQAPQHPPLMLEWNQRDRR